MSAPKGNARKQILQAALKQFAANGYAGASVRNIVAETPFTQPTLYYYFRNKAALYKALLDLAHDECYERMQAAAARHREFPAQLVETVVALFKTVREKRDLMRLAFASAFAAPKEIPPEARTVTLVKGKRNLAFVESLIRQAQARQALTPAFNSTELAYALYSALTFEVMRFLLEPQKPLNRRRAERLVALFLQGALPRNR
ncbi:MAG: TetR/AcrR family transcriptional regulator [Verrucomicrobia bacterium]|nr:TetR/AcrR family transcriptional regulator [Verrucomicrobiota bacterium]